MRAMFPAMLLLSGAWAALLYLGGAWAAASFNIAAWEPFGRFLAALFWVAGTLTIFGAAAEAHKENEAKRDK